MTKLFSILGGSICIAAVHILVVGNAPFPLTALNTVIAIAVILFFLLGSPLIVWAAVPAFYIIDLYAAAAPFGTTLVAGTTALLLGYWLHRDVFTNRSWLAAGMLTTILLLMYRILYALIVVTVFILGDTVALPGWYSFVVYVLWEEVITATVVAGVLFFLSTFVQSLRTHPVEGQLFRI